MAMVEGSWMPGWPSTAKAIDPITRATARKAYFIHHFDCGRGLPPGDVQPAGGSYSFRVLVLSAVGKSAGTFCVTLPVAAHSVPRWYVVMKPTQFSAARSWPIAVWKTRPLP